MMAIGQVVRLNATFLSRYPSWSATHSQDCKVSLIFNAKTICLSFEGGACSYLASELDLVKPT